MDDAHFKLEACLKPFRDPLRRAISPLILTFDTNYLTYPNLSITLFGRKL